MRFPWPHCSTVHRTMMYPAYAADTDVAKGLKESSRTPAPTDEAHHDKQQYQSDALKKLTGDTRSPVQPNRPREIAATGLPKSTPASQPMSLAAFMGGRATGPRLNRHAPQADSHDPTLFAQRTVAAPHPIFGRGGVAMPGMTARGRVTDREEHEPAGTPTVSSRDRKPSTSQEGASSVRALVQNAEERRRAVAAQKRSELVEAESREVRQRAISTPSAAPPSQNSTPSWKREPIRDHSSTQSSRPTTPGNQSSSQGMSRSGRHTPTRPTTPSQPGRVETASPLPQARTPQPTPRTPAPRSPASTATAGLAKPIQPTPRKSYQGPDIQLAQSSSPGYLRTPSTKEPTPSISRLQGRGFVQSIVKASSQVETGPQRSAGNSSPSPVDKERGRDSPKKASVLDRWQFGSDSSPPIIAPKPVPLRKSRTIDPTLAAVPASPVFQRISPPPHKAIKPDHTGKSLKSVASLPSIYLAAASNASARATPARSEAGGDNASTRRGLGSSTTMISYIKPLKTGDNPPTSAPPSRPASAASRSRATSPEVDEMGIRVRSRTRSIGGASMVSESTQQERREAGSSGRPLSHVRPSR